MKKLFIALLALITFNLSQAQTTPSQTKPAKVQAAKPVQAGEKKVVAEKKAAPPATAHLKKDGTPDKRYKQSQHLKKDGTPDKRFKENKK
ncbi:hypothetical protein [Niabella beijingensis]|uniref:hypothetical protein n=1 Tax=Niabella beijingensis TaxID=2872700 RepID=UPI001CBC38C6|nr:hypothetical protein [Niabella beijingensis]MBZ4191450.1 hypothetical protein [Niabella beijingensis]